MPSWLPLLLGLSVEALENRAFSSSRQVERVRGEPWDGNLSHLLLLLQDPFLLFVLVD